MDREASNWHSPSSYLYILHLDAPALAWEYLRRNPKYHHDYADRQIKHVDPRETWNLRFFENPNLDARHAETLWTPTPCACVRLGPTQDPNTATHFCLSTIPGQQTLINDGTSLWLTVRHEAQTFRAYLAPELADGDLCAFLVPPGEDTSHHRKARLAFTRACFSRVPFELSAKLKRPSSITIFHMHALQALDADLADASHRDIAMAMFGEDRIDQDWSADGYLRAQVRHLLRRAHQLMNGRYRALLKSHELR